MRRGIYLAVLVVAVALPAWSQSIKTDGDVEAEGFIGDGSLVTNVDATTLDGNDSSDFAGATETAAVIAALQEQLNDMRRCLATGSRYLDRNDGTVRDCNTGLFWLKDATCADLPGTAADGRADWTTAESAAAALADGTCGLTDGSSPGDWRRPTPSEFCSAWSDSALGCPTANALDSLIDSSLGSSPYVTNAQGDAQWSEGDAFVGVETSQHYWSDMESGLDTAWGGSLGDGWVYDSDIKTNHFFIWPVRGGQ